MKERGFVLVTAILIVFLMLSAFSYVQLKTASHIKTSQFTGKQMGSMVLAEIGAEKAYGIISRNEINTILARGESSAFSHDTDQSLNPVSPFDARSRDISILAEKCGQGSYYLHCGPGKAVIFKISNNPEEPPLTDSDGKVIVRSFGIIKNSLLESEIGFARNQITILESRFRKDKPFILPAPLVFSDPDSGWIFEGDQYRISGGDSAAILLLEPKYPAVQNDLNLLDGSIPDECIDFPGPDISATGDLPHDPDLELVSSPSFWEHFRSNLADFGENLGNSNSTRPKSGFFKFPEGKLGQGKITGVLVTSGEVELSGNFSLEGLLIHLGGGELVLAQGSSVKGGILYKSDESTEKSSIKIRDQVRILYSPQCIDAAHKYLPVTHLGTRIISE